MKFRTTGKAIKANYDAVALGYCEVQTLFSGTEPNAYTCGVYGWNADIYTNGHKAIVTGYRPTGRAPRLSFDDVRGYEQTARLIVSDYSKPYEERQAKLAELRADFFSKI